MSTIVQLTDATFDEEVLNADQPVLVDFWAVWCGPCKAIAPILESVAAEYGDRIKVGKLNIDDNGDTPVQFGVKGIPTLILFKNGKVEGTSVGAVSKNKLIAFLDNHL